MDPTDGQKWKSGTLISSVQGTGHLPIALLPSFD